MTAAEEVEKKIAEYGAKMEEAFHRYTEKAAAAKKECAEKLNAIKEARKNLTDPGEKIRNPKLAAKFRAQPQNAFGYTGDFNIMNYYIDALNAVRHSAVALAKNPSYCTGVLRTIAGEYAALKKKLENAKESAEKELADVDSAEHDKAKSGIAALWAELTEETDAIAEAEAKRIVAAVRAKAAKSEGNKQI